MSDFKSIRYGIKRENFWDHSIVILIHPWKGSWGSIFVEDMHSMSSWLQTHLSVKEAKFVAKKLVSFIHDSIDRDEEMPTFEELSAQSSIFLKEFWKIEAEKNRQARQARQIEEDWDDVELGDDEDSEEELLDRETLQKIIAASKSSD